MASTFPRRYGALKATAIVGLLWMIFHIPLFLIKGGHPAGYPFWLFAVMILAWSLPFTVVYNGAGRSILLVHILHQSLNAAAEAMPIFPAAAHTLVPILISAVVSLALSCLFLLYRFHLPGPTQKE